MSIKDLLNSLEKIEELVLDLQSKFKEDPNHRWFQNYIFMSEKIKDIVRTFLNPIIEETRRVQDNYSEIYSTRDMKYHTETALRYCTQIKEHLKDVVDIYSKQEDYTKIKVQWEITFSPVARKIKDLRGRLLIIKRILN